ncbi:hypothetical protein J5N97_017260 [Dioscorea zingiberensis]|uniref:Uncharacterized protein n=1 Tax=Dioscorea zingiberensis TaxID=325984 RepID=A0A9D5CNJ3_9LILI|nr:hypothetical protein J5N97_017260 [Dioscorea zingiberensis]
MSQSFDTVGWFAREPTILVQVGTVLLQSSIGATAEPSCIVVPEDCFSTLCSPSDNISQILIKTVEKLFGGHLITQKKLGDYILHEVPSLGNFMIKRSGNQASKTIPPLQALSSAMLPLLSGRNHCNVSIVNLLAQSIDGHFLNSPGLLDYGVLALPTVPEPPPKLGLEASKLADYRAKAFRLLSIAGMSRFCQINIPLGFHENLPVSVSLLARNGADHFLLKFSQVLYGALREEAEKAWKGH